MLFRSPGTPLITEDACERIVILPDRAALYARADARFDAMIADGALAEVSWLARDNLDPTLPVMRAHGVPQLVLYHLGTITLAAAIAEAKLETRRYIKRQMTWLKRNMCSWKAIYAQ